MKYFFKLYAHCVPVGGIVNCVLCDFQRQQIQPIPELLFKILTAKLDLTVKEIISHFESKYSENITEYFNFLEENEYGFFTREPNSFPKTNLEWRSPIFISHAIVDFDSRSTYSINKALEGLSRLRCKYLQLRFFSNIGIELILDSLDHIERNAMGFLGIELIIPSECVSALDINQLMANYPRISLLCLHGSNKDDLTVITGKPDRFIVFVDKAISSHHHCGIISKEHFILTKELYFEGTQRNTCLNGKIGIDVSGNVKNCPSMTKAYGNIEDMDLTSLLNHPEFTALWGITKNDIDICKNCEYRYVCTDCRAYIEDPQDKYSKPLKCGYDPFTGKWETWSDNPLKNKTMAFYNL